MGLRLSTPYSPFPTPCPSATLIVMRPAIRVLLASALLCLSLPSFTQAISTKIYFTGAAPYSDADLTSVVGLQSGQLFNDNEVQAGSQRLVDTGLFDSVAMTGTGKGPTRQVRFTIKPTPDDKLLPASFANFVWFTPAELDHALRTHVPLYHGLLPDSGNFADSVQSALVAMLKEKGINATVSHATVEPTTQHPIRVVNFSVDDPRIAIAALNVNVVTQDSAALVATHPNLRPGANPLYDEGSSGFTIDELLLAPAHNAGYVAAKLDDMQRAWTDTATVHGVTVTAKLTPGDLYKFGPSTWTPTPIYSATDFTRDTLLHPGDVASQKLLLTTEGKVLTAYRAQGYMDAYLHVTPALDTTAHTVAYDLTAVPGEQYHLKTITVVGLTPDARQQFDSGWRMQPGDLYNEPYIQHFLNNNTALLKLNNYAGSYQASADPNTHLVDLIITFVSKANWRP